MPIHIVRIIAAATAAIWICLAVFRGFFWRLRERLHAAPDATGGGVAVTVVISARDEAELIGTAVRSLRSQRFPGALRVIVADDESSDSTAEQALAAGADQVIRVAARPPGWKGKLWAVSRGIAAETGAADYFLLTDADIEYVSGEVLAALIARMETGPGFDLVSVMVRLSCQSLPEKLLIPAFVFFFFMLYPPGWVSNGRGAAAAAGGCMLIRRTTLEKIGGIEAIRDALIDDCALAQRVKAAGGRVWLGLSDEETEVRSTRTYGHAAEIRTMISRAAFSQLRHSVFLLAGTVAGMLLTYVAPVALLFSRDVFSVACGAGAWLLCSAMFLPMVRYYRAPLWTAVSLPAVALFYLAATLESAVNYWSGRGGAWKGRVQDEIT